MQLEGQVIDIIYKNDINSYTVATFETSEQEETTIVGYLPFVNEGDNLKITGDIVKHPDYGEQFKIATFEKTMPTTPEALEKYLSNGSFKGVGPATAKKIVNTFGKDTINVIKLEPQKLTQIKGISKEKALEITEQFVANWEIWQIVGFLDKFGIGPQSAEGVYKKLGEGALERISENPYILVDVASKVNFEKVDRIAMEMGVEESNYKRIRSGIKYGLEKIGLNGNSCVLYDNLIKYEQDLLRVDINNIEEAIIQMKAKEEIVLEDRPDGKEWVYSKNFYEAEKNIAEKIVGLRNADNVKRIRTLREDLRIIEDNIDIELSEKQREAIESINEHNVCIITGGPGTGKTTIQVQTITLNQIFRQAAKSKIIVNAHRVNEGESFISGNVKETQIDEENIELLDDFFYINEANQEKIQQTIVSLCKGRLKKFGNYDFFSNIQVITPTKKGKLGTKELNVLLQKELNPEEVDKDEKEFGEIKFREQDRVMQTKNNYNLLWEKDNDRTFRKELGNGIFNGELGIIDRINKEEKTVRVKFDDGKIATYDNTDLDQLEHAYAITVHKSQGSEFDVVILVASQSAPMLLTRNLIYTAMTRAKKLLIVIGSQSVVSYMIQNNTTRQRNTGLTYKLRGGTKYITANYKFNISASVCILWKNR